MKKFRLFTIPAAGLLGFSHVAQAAATAFIAAGYRQSKLCLSVLAMAIASVTSMSAFAASDPQMNTMETVIVAGSLIGNSELEDVKEYPGACTVLSNEQIKKTAALSIDSAFQSVPGIKVQDETGAGVLPNISVRGLKASRSSNARFLMDGVPLTLAPYGYTGQSIFPATLSMLDRIDKVSAKHRWLARVR